MSLVNRATRSTNHIPSSRLVPPDWVFLMAWPALKAGALNADLLVARLPGGGARLGLLALRGVDWAAFLAFPAIAPRSGRASVVAAITLVQAVATGEAMRRGRRLDTRIAASLAPQLAWLAYATAVPLIMARPKSRRAGRPVAAAH